MGGGAAFRMTCGGCWRSWATPQGCRRSPIWGRCPRGSEIPRGTRNDMWGAVGEVGLRRKGVGARRFGGVAPETARFLEGLGMTCGRCCAQNDMWGAVGEAGVRRKGVGARLFRDVARLRQRDSSLRCAAFRMTWWVCCAALRMTCGQERPHKAMRMDAGRGLDPPFGFRRNDGWEWEGDYSFDSFR